MKGAWVMKGFRDLDAVEMARVEGGSIWSWFVEQVAGAVIGTVVQAVRDWWHSVTYPGPRT